MELLVKGPTKELEKNLLLTGMEKSLPSAFQFAPFVVNTVLAYDENATGILSRDPSLLENATVSVLKAITAKMGVSINEKALREIYESNGNTEVLDRIAVEILKGGPHRRTLQGRASKRRGCC
ncbi:hypothetical protein [Thermococcus sp.]|uniref:hypothetical protein n=1 Tax=Thermococcus sp. TaxID=35749 RepID=UPI00262C5BAF|nr:hypothetical protein [Thermococcus sp.]